MKTVDLTQTLENGMAVYPGAPLPVFKQEGSVANGDPYQLTKIEFTTHTGTHLDCSTHVMEKGYYADREDLGFFMGKGIAIDCSKYGEGEKMGMEIFEGHNIEGVEFVLLYCDWAKYWYEPTFWGEYPYMTKEVAHFIADHATIRGIGVEYAAIDPLADTALPLHKIIMAKNKIIIENLKNLDVLLHKEFTFIGLPLKLKNGDGSPIRAVALLAE